MRATMRPRPTTNAFRAVPQSQARYLPQESFLVRLYLALTFSSSHVINIALAPMTKSCHRVSGSFTKTSRMAPPAPEWMVLFSPWSGSTWKNSRETSFKPKMCLTWEKAIVIAAAVVKPLST